MALFRYKKNYRSLSQYSKLKIEMKITPALKHKYFNIMLIITLYVFNSDTVFDIPYTA